MTRAWEVLRSGRFWLTFAICAAVLLSALSLRVVAMQQREFAVSRAGAVTLLCDMNDVLRDFIAEPPDLPRDVEALRRLDAERCGVIVREAREQAGR